jgi:hypothetical protein
MGPRTDHSWDVARTHSDWAHAADHVRRLQRQAGRAASDPEAARRALGDALADLAAMPPPGAGWAQADLERMAQVAGRIERLARALVAADRLPDAQERERVRRQTHTAAVAARDAAERQGGGA